MKTNKISIGEVVFNAINEDETQFSIDCEVKVGFNSLFSSTFNHKIVKGEWTWVCNGEDIKRILTQAARQNMIDAATVREVSVDAMNKLNGGRFTMDEIDELTGGSGRTGTKIKVVMDLFKSRNMTKEQATEIVNDPVKWAKVQAMLENMDI